MIRPEFWEDTTMASMPIPSRHLFIALWNFSDDEGYLKYDLPWLKVKCFPYDDVDIPELLEPLFEKTRLELKNGIIKIKNFKKYQTIQKKVDSVLIKIFDSVPDSSKIPDDYSRATVGLQYHYSSPTIPLRPKISKDKLSKDKIIKKESNKEKSSLSGKEKIKFSEFVKMTQDQYDSLIKKHGEDFTKRCLRSVDLFIPNRKEGPYTCYYSAINRWVIKAVKKEIREEKKPEGESSASDRIERLQKIQKNQEREFKRERDEANRIWLLERKNREKNKK